MVDTGWPKQPEKSFSGWLDSLDDEGSFSKRWLYLHERCLRIFKAPPVGVAPPRCAPPGEAAMIYEIADLRKGFKCARTAVASPRSGR